MGARSDPGPAAGPPSPCGGGGGARQPRPGCPGPARPRRVKSRSRPGQGYPPLAGAPMPASGPAGPVAAGLSCGAPLGRRPRPAGRHGRARALRRPPVAPAAGAIRRPGRGAAPGAAAAGAPAASSAYMPARPTDRLARTRRRGRPDRPGRGPKAGRTPSLAAPTSDARRPLSAFARREGGPARASRAGGQTRRQVRHPRGPRTRTLPPVAPSGPGRCPPGPAGRPAHGRRARNGPGTGRCGPGTARNGPASRSIAVGARGGTASRPVARGTGRRGPTPPAP